MVQEAPSKPPPHDRATILIVDDVPDIVVTIGRVLRDYQSRAATSGADTLDWVLHSRVDLMHLDASLQRDTPHSLCGAESSE
ncbi:hypothetical protein [Nitrogeniibacter aestuarii]|uniref:hypothetical protein n=1 Tax=Nitrogeniibacter aestuarii TaxID=2815343 RepID=UPI001E350119|nr:hypothetical protein [Nitrogeniibacter aestuarii]